jgi:hypothetical protein
MDNPEYTVLHNPMIYIDQGFSMTYITDKYEMCVFVCMYQTSLMTSEEPMVTSIFILQRKNAGCLCMNTLCLGREEMRNSA